MYNKTIVRFSFGIIKVSVRVIRLSLQLWQITPNSSSNIVDYTFLNLKLISYVGP